ncbi:MAG: c-type cytochrome [Saprospiraceae bacterium]|nr:c-type cytochrome [Saprospiraceae bacterium]
MEIVKNLISIFLLFVMATGFYSCQQPGKNQTGSEYFPDMAHSIAYEANTYTYYYHNTWGTEEEYHSMAQPRKPVMGTIARGAAGTVNTSNNGENSHIGISIPSNGSVPYYYADTEEDRLRAIAEIIKNPYPISMAGLEKGKNLYIVFCATCHGDKGDGAGYLVRDDGGKYPVQPANFLLDEFVTASNGRYYHSIIHGRNLMGAYSDKLSFEERWQVIHYIRSLQAADKKLDYNENSNTLTTVDIPLSKQNVIVPPDTDVNLSGGGQ